MAETIAPAATALRLSCNHTLTSDDMLITDVVATEGAKVPCPKCPARKVSGSMPMRRVRTVVRSAEVVAEATAAERMTAMDLAEEIAAGPGPDDAPSFTHDDVLDDAPVVPEPNYDDPALDGDADGPVAMDTGVDHGPATLARAFRVFAEAYQGRPDETAPATSHRYDVNDARAEHAAVKAWNEGGRTGDRPATPNLDALNAAHEAGVSATQRRKANRTAAGARTPRNADPIRVAANEARKAKGTGGRSNLHRLSDGDLLAYVRDAIAYSPNSRSVDLRDYALWVDEVSVSYARWDRAFADANDPSVADGDGGRDEA